MYKNYRNLNIKIENSLEPILFDLKHRNNKNNKNNNNSG